jgi:uncharacterized protein
MTECEKEAPRPERAPGTLTVGGVAFDWRLSLVIFLGGMLPIVNHYHRITAGLAKLGPAFGHFRSHLIVHGWDQVLLFLLVPLAVVLVVFRERPGDYGFGLGRWREGLVWMGVTFPVIALCMGLIAWSSQEMRGYYMSMFYPMSGNQFRLAETANPSALAAHAYMLYLCLLVIVPWEFLWRGFFLFALARKLTPGAAIFLQALPFALLHIGKPELETITTMLGGVGFGFVAWRTRSFLYAMLIHLFMLACLNLFIYHA